MSQGTIASLLALLLYLLGYLGSGVPQGPGQMPSDRTELPGSTTSGQGAVAPKVAVVTGSSVTVRSGPGTSYEPLSSAAKGNYVTVVGVEGDWSKVRLPGSGQLGWIWTPLLSYDVPGPAPNGPVLATGFTVAGYYVEDRYNPSFNSLVQYGNSLTTVIPWMWRLDGSGNLVSDFTSSDLKKALGAAGAGRITSLALIHNYDKQSFNGATLHGFLTDPEARQRAVNNILEGLNLWGMNGVNLDFENVLPEDREHLTAFVRELSERLAPKGLLVTLSVPAKTSNNPTNPLVGAFDYSALGRYADQIMIMTYDEHYRLGPPGPVASIGWVERVVKYASSVIPPGKILLGLSAYGYDWPASGGGARALTYFDAMAVAQKNGASVRWEPTHKVPYFTYGGGRQVWFENRYSLSYKLELVKQYGLGGTVMWRLGQEDPGVWQVFGDTLNYGTDQ